MRSRPVALIPISQHFSIRYFVLSGLLDKLKSHVECVLVLAWTDPVLEEELRARGFRFLQMPEFEADEYYKELRRWKNAVQEPDMRSPTPAIDLRRRRALGGSFKEQFYFWRADTRRLAGRLLGAIPVVRSAIERLEERAFYSHTNREAFARQISDVQPDVLISATPFILQESVYCRVARQLGVRLIGSILSFDNLSSRGKIDVTFDQYLVWNHYMKAEALRIYGVSEQSVSIVGAVQMDFYARGDMLLEKEEFLRVHGLDSSRPIILFAAGPHHIAPVEPHILHQLDGIVEEYPADRRPQILLRPHPVDDLDRWKPVLDRCNNVKVARSWSVKGHFAGRINRDDIRALVSTLAWTDVHISTSSTMSLDGAIFDKPQIALAYDDQPGAKLDHLMVELYAREHYVPLTQSGGIRIVRSRTELARSLAEYLDNPGSDRQKRRQMVEDVCVVPIGKAADAVAEAILEYLGETNAHSREAMRVSVPETIAT